VALSAAGSQVTQRRKGSLSGSYLVFHATVNTEQVKVTDITDVVKNAKHLKQVRQSEKKRQYKQRQSKLDVHEKALYEMQREECSLLEIQIALRSLLKPAVICSRSTIQRYLNRPDTELTKL